MTEKRKAYLWEFPQGDGEEWPPELEPVRTEGWPAEGPVVVHAGAAGRFQREVMDHLQ